GRRSWPASRRPTSPPAWACWSVRRSTWPRRRTPPRRWRRRTTPVDIGQPSGAPTVLERTASGLVPPRPAGRISLRTQAGRRLLRLLGLGALLLAVLGAGGYWLY